MKTVKLILLFLFLYLMFLSVPVSARNICENGTPPPGWEVGSSLKKMPKCPTGKGYQIRKTLDLDSQQGQTRRSDSQPEVFPATPKTAEASQGEQKDEIKKRKTGK